MEDALVDLDELCGALRGGADAASTTFFDTPPDAVQRVPVWQRPLVRDMDDSEEAELRRLEGRVPCQLAQSPTETPRGGLEGGFGPWGWSTLLQSPTEGVAHPFEMQPPTEGLGTSLVLGSRQPAVASSLSARATSLPVTTVEAGPELVRHLEEARQRHSGSSTLREPGAEEPFEGSNERGMMSIPSASFVATTLANPYASAHDVAAASGALVLQRCTANGGYPTLSEWRVHTHLLCGQFWLCIRCRIVNRMRCCAMWWARVCARDALL